MREVRRILFFSSVRTKKMFSIQSYYRNDISILRDLGFQVKLSNNIFDFLKFWKYDIAFFYFYRYSALAAIFAKLFCKKTIFTGGIDYLESSFATKRQQRIQAIFFKICNLFSDANIIVSTTDYNNIATIYSGMVPHKCRMSFHVIDAERFVYKGEPKLRIISTIAWMVNRDNVYRKGVDKTIKAFAKFVQLFPDYKLIIVGPPGEGSKDILKLIERLNMSKYVEYKGAISEDEKVGLLKRSTIYTQLSVYEGFGIAAIEALAAGNIVVHSGYGGLKDAVSDCGIIVDINSFDSIVDGFVQAISYNNIQLSDIRAKGIHYVEENFSYSKRLSDFRSIFHEIGIKVS